MELRRGLIVRSAAGRDKNNFFVVIDCDLQYAHISDGKSRPISKPKKKKRKHLFVTNTLLDEALLETNKKIKNALYNFRGKDGNYSE
jgi:ribosomal protein L14E/L6E/L27E